jgi:TolA-binding protein
MLSSVLNSKLAIVVNISIMRAFVAVRRFVLNPPVQEVKELRGEINELRRYIEEVLSDYNDINEDTRMQLELINKSLAELQSHKQITDKPRQRIGYQFSYEKNEQP